MLTSLLSSWRQERLLPTSLLPPTRSKIIMVKFLLDALSSLAAAEDSKHKSGGDDDSQAISLERATLVKIGTSLGSLPPLFLLNRQSGAGILLAILSN
jgi:hypothetical protein